MSGVCCRVWVVEEACSTLLAKIRERNQEMAVVPRQACTLNLVLWDKPCGRYRDRGYIIVSGGDTDGVHVEISAGGRHKIHVVRSIDHGRTQYAVDVTEVPSAGRRSSVNPRTSGKRSAVALVPQRT